MPGWENKSSSVRRFNLSGSRALQGLLGSRYAAEFAAGSHIELHELLPDLQAWLEVGQAKAKPRLSGTVLSAREHEVLQCLIQGASDKCIAQIRSPSTVSQLVANMLGKLGLDCVMVSNWPVGRQNKARKPKENWIRRSRHCCTEGANTYLILPGCQD
ncbi:response regulator transcription factor [Deinococcus hopiensis]|uniref:response regulator transcription factor n=1 Tax=Deinococcus hopiensis TaxID=309885 RepID=UPI000A061AB4|nr:helix-turn-helix transcriptional regulator [Deinococcus hopiensis]